MVPAIESELIGDGSDRNTWGPTQWKELIRNIRQRWQRKYKWTPESGGQDDAAELLGDILYDYLPDGFAALVFETLPGRFVIAQTRFLRAAACEHEWTRTLNQHMIVLAFPPKDHSVEEPQYHLKRDLLRYYESEEPIDDLTCDSCKIPHQSGKSWTRIERWGDVIVFRIQRYGISEDGIQVKRSSALRLDDELTLSGSEFILVAIVEHSGNTPSSGHYQTIVRADSGWQRRNDSIVTEIPHSQMPAYNKRDIYLVVYAQKHVVQARLGLAEHQSAQATTQRQVAKFPGTNDDMRAETHSASSASDGSIRRPQVTSQSSTKQSSADKAQVWA